MGRTAHERISQRAYALRLGVSNELVSRAVKEGKIKKGWDKKAGKIIVEWANKEWGVLHADTSTISAVAKLDGNIELPKQPEPQFKDEEDEDDFQFEDSEDDGNDIDLGNNTTFAEAVRVEKLMTARLKKLDVQERKGQLVSKSNVFKELFQFGQSLRVSLLAIPDRVIDDLLAAKNRGEAHLLLTGAIHEVLEQLTDPKLEFKPRQ